MGQAMVFGMTFGAVAGAAFWILAGVILGNVALWIAIVLPLSASLGLLFGMLLHQASTKDLKPDAQDPQGDKPTPSS